MIQNSEEKHKIKAQHYFKSDNERPLCKSVSTGWIFIEINNLLLNNKAQCGLKSEVGSPILKTGKLNLNLIINLEEQ